MGHLTRKEGDDPGDGRSLSNTRDRALRLLAMRSHGKDELRRKLLAKGEPPDHVAQVLEACEQQGYLDDAVFAYNRTIARVAGKGYGPIKVRSELLALGIEPTLVAQGMARAMAEIDLEAVVGQVVARRCAKNMPGSSVSQEKSARKRCFDILFRRGFDSETIQLVLP
ncbi:MAG: regulatory protein RecX [Magnetococcales bacterium]|nr:regulatory protein RecX [Magnetococcales bacterium]